VRERAGDDGRRGEEESEHSDEDWRRRRGSSVGGAESGDLALSSRAARALIRTRTEAPGSAATKQEAAERKRARTCGGESA
jgi:hypothetical protein